MSDWEPTSDDGTSESTTYSNDSPELRSPLYPFRVRDTIDLEALLAPILPIPFNTRPRERRQRRHHATRVRAPVVRAPRVIGLGQEEKLERKRELNKEAQQRMRDKRKLREILRDELLHFFSRQHQPYVGNLDELCDDLVLFFVRIRQHPAELRQRLVAFLAAPQCHGGNLQVLGDQLKAFFWPFVLP